MRERFNNVVEKMLAAVKTQKFIKKLNMTSALMLLGVIFSEIFFTSMSLDNDYTIYVTVDGTVTQTEVETNHTVAMVLAEQGIILGEHDEVNFPLDTVVAEKMSINIDRVEYIYASASKAIPYETLYEESTLHKMGDEFVTRKGETGCKITTYKKKIVNGKIEELKVAYVEEFPPVDEIITVGTAFNEPYSKRLGDFELDNGIPTEYAYVVGGKVTAYTAPPGSGTYSGRPLEIGTVAVNPNIIPFGSELYICSKDGKRVYGYAVAADTGDLTEVVADVFMGLTSEHYSDACKWGAQFCNVYVLTIGDNSVSWM